MKNKNKDNNYTIPPSIYFGGCGFGSVFYVGVYKAMVEKWGPDFYKHTLLCGGSAGAITALAIALGKGDEMGNLYIDVAKKALDRGYYYRPSDFLEDSLRRIVNSVTDAYKLLEGRCAIGTTAFFSKHRWHVSWADNEDLINCIIGSYHVPIYCRKIETIQSIEVVDGAYGISGKDFPHGNETLFIGIDPFAEVSRELTFIQMFKPSYEEEYVSLSNSGYIAFQLWDGKMIDKVNNRVSNNIALRYLWMMKFIHIFVDFIISNLLIIFMIILCYYYANYN